MKVDRKVKAEKRPPKAKTVKGNGRAAPKVSGKQLLAAYEHIPVGIVEASLDGKYMDVNAEFCRILGYSRRELLQRGIKDYTHEDDYGIDFKLHQDLIAGKIPFYRLEKRFVRKGGGIIWTELTRSLVCDEKGKPLHTMGVVLDISDRKDVESVLRDSVEQLRLATGAAQMFMWEWDFQNRSYTIADNFEKVLGFSAGLLPKNSFETVWALSPNEDIQRISEEYQRAIEQRRDLRVVPCRVINPETGQIVWLEVSAKIVYDGEGNPERMFGVAQNITESKEIQDEIAVISRMPEENPNPVMRLTLDGAILYANPASAPLMKDWSGDAEHVSAIPQDLQKTIKEAFASGAKAEVEIEHQGTIFSFTVAPIVEGGYVNLYGRDITESKKAEAAVHLARHQAERSAERTARLQEVTAALSEALTPAQVAEVLTTHGARAFGAMHSTMMLLSEDGQTLEILYSTVEESLIRPYKHFPVSLQVPAADVVRSGQPVWMESRQQYLERYPHLAEQIHRWGQQAAVAVPMIYEERILGVLTFSFDRVLADNQEDRGYALTLARQGAQALDRSRAENALRESEERFRAIVSQATAGITESDLDSRLVFANPGLCAMLGYSEEELLGKTIWELTYTDDVEENKRLFKRMLEEGKAYQFEKRFIRKDGSLLWASVSVTAIHDLAGNPKGSVGVVLDIQKRKQAELGLAEYARQQEALYQLSDRLHRTSSFEEIYNAGLDAILDALQCNRASILLFDEHDVMRFVAWRGLSDAYRKAVEGHSPWQRDVKDPQPVSIDDVRTAELDESLRRVIQGEGIGSLAFIPLVSNGALIGKFMVYFDMPHVFDEGDLDLSLTIARQLIFGIDRLRADEQLRQSEERFRTMANTMPSIVWTAAPDGRITYANDQWFRYVGITPEANATGWPELVLHPDDYERCVRAWTQAIETVPDEYLIEVRNRRYDGQYRWFQTRAVPVRDEAGKAKAWYGVTTDIHERIESENRLALLAAISDMLRNVDNPYDLMYRISEAVGEQLHVKRALFNETDLEHDRETVHRDYHNGVNSVAGVHKLSDYSSLTSAEMRAGKTVINDDSMIDPRTAMNYEKTYAGSGERAYVAVPLMRDNRWVASFWVSDDAPRRWTSEEVSLLETVAERTWAIVEKLRMADELRAKEAELEAIINQTPFMLTRCTRDMRYRFVSRAYADMIGHTPEEIAGKPIVEIMGAEGFKTILPYVEQVLQGNRVEYESSVSFEGSGTPYLHVIYTPDWDEWGNVIGWFGSIVDITERKRIEEALRESEQRFREIFETAGVSVWVEDFSEVSRALEALRAQGVQDLRAYFRENPEFVRRAVEMVRILDVNNETLDLFGATSKADLLQSLDKIFVPETEPSFIEELIALAEGREMVRAEATGQTLDGRRISVIFTVHFGPPGGDLRRVVVTLTDITARKQVEEALRESEQRYRAVVESQSEMLCRFQPDGTILFANGAYARARGTMPEALASRNLWDFIAEADRPFVREMLENLTPESPEVQIENRFQTVEGERWTLWTNRGLRFDASGRWLEAQSSGIDITDRKQAEEALRASEERMRLATDAAGMFAWEFDIQNQSFSLSDNVAEVLGFSADLVSKSLEAVQSLNHSEHALIETVQRFSTAEDTSMIWEAMAKAFEQQVDLRDLQYRLVDPESGQVVWVEVNARTIYDREGRPERMYGVSQNITERKRIEAALRIENERFLRFVDSNIVGILIGDASGNVIIANDYYLRLLGVTRREFEQGKVDWKQFTPPEWLAADEKAIQELRERGICEPYEKEYMRTDGRRVPVYIADAMLPGPGEEIAAFVVDITERKRAENALGIRARQQQAVAQLGELALRERDLQEVFNHATAAVAETLEVEYCNVLELMGGGVSLLLRAGVGWKEGLVGTAMVGAGLNSQAGFTLQSATPIIVDDLREERRFNGPPLLIDHGVISGMSCIIRGPGGLPWGVLGTHSSRRMSFTQDDVNFLVAIANILGDAIQREQVEDDLRASEERYRFIVENTSDGIWWIELTEPMPLSLSEDEQIDWYYKYAVIRQCNLGMARMYGYDSIEEVIGLPLRTVMPRENPVNLELSRQFVRSGYRLVDAESREIDRDGRALVFLNNMVGIVDNGKLVGEWGTNRDITARKRAEEALRASEELYRAIARSIPGGGVYVVDKDLRYLVAEGPVTKAFGLSREMLEGRTVLEVFPNAAGERMVERLERNFAGETVSFETTFNGRFYWTQQAPLLDSIGHAIVVTLDITERKKAEEALRQSEERFARFMQHLPGLAWIKDVEGRYVYANAAAEKAFNTPREKLYGRTDEDIFPSEVAAQFRRNDAQALTEEKGIQVIETLEHVDGVLHSSLVNKFPIPGPDGNTILIGGTAFDITERLGAEEALRESEERFRAILRQATAGIVRKDAEGRLVYVNEAFCNMLGYTESDLIGKTVWDFMHPDDIAESQRSYQRLMLEGIPFNLERRFLREDGSVIWVDASVSPIMDATGKPQSAVAVEVDVTGRKQAEDALRELNLQLEDRVLSRTARLRTVNQTLREEIAERKKIEEALRRSEAAARENEEKLRTLFDLLPVGISFLDPGGQVIQMNSALVSILKLSREEMGNQAYRSRTYIRANGTLMPPAEFASARALAEGKTIYGVETGIVLEDGEVIWMSVSAAPVAVADVGALVVTVDITDSKRAERALQESRERLQILSQRLVEVQEEERRAIARELHDRVGQTLAALNINLLIVNSQLTDKVDEAIRTRMQDSMKLVAETIALVRDVMSNLRPSVLDDYGLEAALQSHVEQYMSRYEIKVALDKPKPSLPRLGPSVEMTFLRIAQEGLMNIAKHAQASEVRLSLRQEQDAIHMIIQDNGTGIQSWEMANRPGSHGITIMRERAEAIGGNLKVTSIPGEGTMVEVSIPMENREQPRDHKESQ